MPATYAAVKLALPSVGLSAASRLRKFAEAADRRSPPLSLGCSPSFRVGYPGSSYSTVEAAVMAGVTALTNTSTHSEDLLNISGY